MKHATVFLGALLFVLLVPSVQAAVYPLDVYRPGDLFFFWTGEKARHVGIYLENGEFFHASTSEGVTISHIDDDYWKYRLITVRRIEHDLTLAELKFAFNRYDPARYRYGYDGPDQFDCSGLVWRVFKNHGIELPRSTRGQIRLGTAISK